MEKISFDYMFDADLALSCSTTTARQITIGDLLYLALQQ